MPWEVAPTIWAYVAASNSSFSPVLPGSVGLLQQIGRISVAIVTLYQTIDFLPNTSRGRFVLFAFALWPLSSLMQHTALFRETPFLLGGGAPQIPHDTDKSLHHPIEQLIVKARNDYELLIKRQSETLDSAVAEYNKRYSRQPPPGFGKWFAYAQSKNSVIIDDFDMIIDDLKPFRKITPRRLLESIDHVTKFEHLALRKCGFTKGVYHGQGGGWIVDDLGMLLREVWNDLPDVEFAFDVIDEPRIIITQDMLDTGGVSEPEFQDADHHSIWNRATSSCKQLSATPHSPNVDDLGIPFVQDWKQAKDVCAHPEYGLMHGFFATPASCLLTDAPIPVLSQAAPSSFGDIKYPSPWYQEKVDEEDYKVEEDPSWEDKSANLYWAGSTTGQYSRNGSWKHAHRPRFVQLIQTFNETEHLYMKQTKAGSWSSYKAVEDHSALFDVKLTAIIQCEEKDCEEQKAYFSVGDHDREEGNKQFQSQFAFDIDGNSFSGRFYTLLQSRSVVLKQTVLKEWHDERLVPWVHFIPVSMSMAELPEIMRYMTSDENGKGRAKEIANASRDWHGKVLRREDFTIYLYRLMLELARIMDPKREVEH